MSRSPFLIVGLGNPGKEYEKTRHNIGTLVVEAFARELGLTFKKEAKVKGYVAKGIIGDQRVIFLIPTTFMNLSGESVRKCMDYFDVELKNLLVLSDDTYLKFGDTRFRKAGSAGGHNGLKDIEQKLSTQSYARLKIGIGEKDTYDLSDYVLSNFTKQELEKMDEVADKAIAEIKQNFLSQGDDQAGKQKEDLGEIR